MFKRVDESERTYKVIDSIYRLHRDLFEIESFLIRSSKIQIRLAKISINGRMGIMIAGLLAILPILISLGDIKWGSAPAITIYLLIGAVVLLWISQVISAGHVDKELIALEGYIPNDALEDRLDFVLEEINSSVNRYKLIENILRDLKEVEESSNDEKIKCEVKVKQVRYEEILESCQENIEDSIKKSEKLVEKGKRSEANHNQVLDWAAAIPKFAKKKIPRKQ